MWLVKMRSPEMKKVGGICVVLGLAASWACTEIDVRIPSQLGLSDPRVHQEKEPITLKRLKEIQKEKMELSRNPVTTRCDIYGSTKLNLAPEPQETSDWCWAATSRMVIAFHNGLAGDPTHRQCSIVSNSVDLELNRVDCCPSEAAPARTECMGGGWPWAVFDKYDFDYEVVEEALDWESLTNEICGTGPFLYVLNLEGGGKHALVAAGYRTANISEANDPSQTQQLVQIYDPTHDDFQLITHAEFVGNVPAPNGLPPHFHDRDYVQISPNVRRQP